MSDLKTLKDLSTCKRKNCPDEEFHVVEIKKAKQEAIKDIKFLRHMKEAGFIKLLPWMTTTDPQNTGLNAIINYIMWKFNITEEDL